MRKNGKNQKIQADAQQLTAMNSTEALEFRRNKVLFDFFEYDFIRMNSMK